MTRYLKRQRRDDSDFNITLRWIPGHEGVQGNEHADQEAKKAAEGQHQNSPNRELPKYLRDSRLLCSAAALKAAHKIKSKEHWKTIWEKSPRNDTTPRGIAVGNKESNSVTQIVLTKAAVTTIRRAPTAHIIAQALHPTISILTFSLSAVILLYLFTSVTELLPIFSYPQLRSSSTPYIWTFNT
ncbi:hypothetical protein EV702DRAFT_1266217 [Suillus placidus]|uniref:RNase H type-1 domain-containing protein n=1 Tax=Suillus placidus TaxID=48579 RepID=A0A9P7A2N6_9AGAM|nr:hypothetical protein EV702DRAFT_1266217 [Suillus placidus]